MSDLIKIGGEYISPRHVVGLRSEPCVGGGIFGDSCLTYITLQGGREIWDQRSSEEIYELLYGEKADATS